MSTLALVLLLPCALASETEDRSPRLPIDLRDPGSDGTKTLEAGAPALHVVFFATWCPPCRKEMSRLTELVARWGDGGYRLVLIAVRTRQSVERLRRFTGEGGAPGEVLFDSRGEAESRFGADLLPAHFLFDGEGNVVMSAPALNDELESEIRRLVIQHMRQGG